MAKLEIETGADTDLEVWADDDGIRLMLKGYDGSDEFRTLFGSLAPDDARRLGEFLSAAALVAAPDA